MGNISLSLSSLAEEDISNRSKIVELVNYWILGNTLSSCQWMLVKTISDVMNRKLEKGFAVSEGDHL